MLLRTGIVACLVVLATAACGGAPRRAAPPKLPRALAQQWASEADNVAYALQANNGCRAKRLARSLAGEVDADKNRVPARLRPGLVTAAASLVDRISCTPKPPTNPEGPKGHDKHGHGHADGQGGNGDGG